MSTDLGNELATLPARTQSMSAIEVPPRGQISVSAPTPTESGIKLWAYNHAVKILLAALLGLGALSLPYFVAGQSNVVNGQEASQAQMTAIVKKLDVLSPIVIRLEERQKSMDEKLDDLKKTTEKNTTGFQDHELRITTIETHLKQREEWGDAMKFWIDNQKGNR